uniref:Uncharacterized protein n=1 Tax=Anguilla anguilla TaxID=7936 RepID=A0A0E9R808_ANGAN
MHCYVKNPVWQSLRLELYYFASECLSIVLGC